MQNDEKIKTKRSKIAKHNEKTLFICFEIMYFYPSFLVTAKQKQTYKKQKIALVLERDTDKRIKVTYKKKHKI